MSNLSRLTEAGLIAPSATLSEADQGVINSLSDAEVSALISISQKLPQDFVQRHFGSATALAPTAGRTVGIVF